MASSDGLWRSGGSRSQGPARLVDSFLGPVAFREPPCVSSHAGVLAMTLTGQGNNGDDRSDSSLTIGAEEELVSQCR